MTKIKHKKETSQRAVSKKTARDSVKLANLNQELFCKLYTSDKEFYGNGVQSYIEAYKPDQSKPNWYKSACAGASRLLSNVKVCEKIGQLLENQGLSSEFVDKQLLFLITQQVDFKTKITAIREFNRIRGRVEDKLVANNDFSLSVILDEIESNRKNRSV